MLPIMATRRNNLPRNKINSPKKNIPNRNNEEESEFFETDNDMQEEHDEVDESSQRNRRRLRFEVLDENHSSRVLFDDSKTNYKAKISNLDKKKEYQSKQAHLYPNLQNIENERKPGTSVDRKGFAPFILIGGMFFIIALIFYFGNLYKSINEPLRSKKSLSNVYNDIKSNLIELKMHTEQTQKFWRQIITEMNILVEEKPPQPAILLALVPLDSQKTGACLSQRILDIVSSSFEDPNYVSFDVQSHREMNVTALKHSIDDTLKGLRKLHAAGIYNIEKLAAEAATIFHGYCDNENAPFKRALFMLTMELDVPYSSIDLERLDSLIYNHLMELWGKRQRDVDSAAIISRIANSPIVFKPIADNVIKTLCPY